MNIFTELIKEICDENEIKFELLSKDWIIKLTKSDKIKYIVGTRFPLNDYCSACICKDKYALYQVLKSANIPVLEHKLMYSKRVKNYHSDLKGKTQIKEYLKKCGQVVVKDNCGQEGIDVYRASSYSNVKNGLSKIFKMKDTAVITPFMNIEKEYRVVCLNDKAKIVFSKERNNGEWKHNLCSGATAVLVKDEVERNNLTEFALKVMKTIGAKFASVDLIKVDGKLLVLEVNGNVYLNGFMEQIEEGRIMAKQVYTEAMKQIFIEE